MPSRRRNTGVAEPSEPELTLDDLRGRRPEELRAIVARLDADLADLHVGDDGELRDLTDAEQSRFDRLANLRARAEARLREHERIAEVFRRNPGALVRTFSNALNFQNELARVLQDAVTQLTMTAYTTGDGSGKPKGFVPNATAPSRTAGAFTAADVTLLQNSLPPRFSANARWAANIAVINTIAGFETTAGNLKFPEIRNDPPSLLTKPLHEVSNMAADMSTAASRFLAYGDFQQYVIVDRVGSTLEILPGYGANMRPTGQRHAFLYFRTGGDLIVTTAIQVIAKS